MQNLFITPYRVSTITCNADIGKNINLDLNILFLNFKINEGNDAFIWIQYLKDENDNFRGIYPKKKRKSKVENKRNKFDNQVTLIYKFDNQYMPNIKIFKNGNVQMTGIKNVQDPIIVVNTIIKNIKDIYEIEKNIIITNDNDHFPLEHMIYSNFKIRMINTDFKIFEDETMDTKFNIKRKDIHNILINNKYNNKSSFQPGIYQGVKLDFFWNLNNSIQNGICTCSVNCFGKNQGNGNGNCKKVTIAIFESGSILITGGITFQQVDDAYSYICSIIQENKEKIRKKPILLL